MYVSIMAVDCFVFSCLQQQVKPCLLKLKSDTDIDVQYYALEALEGIHPFIIHPLN